MKRYKKSQSNDYWATPVYGGIRVIDENTMYFNWLKDEKDNDVISLVRPQSGTYDEDGVQYVYGYKYNSNATKDDIRNFRRYIKDAYKNGVLFSEDLEEFVDRAVIELDSYHRLTDFGAIIDTESSELFSIQTVMEQYISEYGNNIDYTFSLLKQTYQDVEFDESLARQSMEAAGKSQKEIDRQVKFLLHKFEGLKATGELFQMKRFTPRELRAGFKNFLKFKTKEEEELYNRLQGVDVLIYDDLYTSGATVKEIIRYLRSFHDENRLTVFVLIKQY